MCEVFLIMQILQLTYTDTLSDYIVKHSDGYVANNFNCYPDDEAYMLVDSTVVAAVGFIRGWTQRWDDKCLGIIVHSDYRRKGYGQLMLNFLEVVGRSRGLKRLRLHVSPKNHKARKMYERNGWYPYGRRDDGEIVMYKKL